MTFNVKVSTEIPVEQFKHLNGISKKTNTTVGALVAELVRRQLTAPVKSEPVVKSRRRGQMSEAEEATVIRMAKAGHNNGEIGRAIGHPSSTVLSCRRKLGLPSAPQGRPRFRDT